MSFYFFFRKWAIPATGSARGEKRRPLSSLSGGFGSSPIGLSQSTTPTTTGNHDHNHHDDDDDDHDHDYDDNDNNNSHSRG